MLCDQVAGVAGDWLVGVIVDFRTRNNRHPFIEQVGEVANHAGLGLPPFTQKDDVMTSYQGVGKLGVDGVVITDHLAEQRLGATYALDGVVS